MEPYKERLDSRAFHFMSLRVLGIGTLPPGSPYGACIRRVMPTFQAFLDMSDVACTVPSKGALLSCDRRRGPIKKRRFYIALSLEVRGKLTALQVPQRGCCGER